MSGLSASLVELALATLRILPRKGSTAWLARSRACLAEPPAESPSTMKISAPAAAFCMQSASLPGRRSLRTALLRNFLLLAAPHTLVGARDDPVQKLRGFLWIVGQPVIERVADGVFDDAH